MIEVAGLTKRYGRHTAVDNVTFTVQKGEILGFLGPNGAGKTTTMRILTCFLPPTEGTARVAGFDVFEDPLEVKRRVGYMPETPPLYPDMDVQSFLDFCAKTRGLGGSARRTRVDEAMEKCRVGDVRRTPIARLSKGYRQRVGLAQAVLHNPDVLILDEPTAGLDPKQIIETRDLIRSLGGEHTVVLSTHILPEVSMTCGRVLIINRGRVVAEDTPENLTQRLQGGSGLRVEARGETGPVFDALRVVPGVVNIRPRDAREGVVAFEVDAEPGREVRPDVARALVEKGFDLLSLQQAGKSLEDVFLQLTTRDDALDDERHTEPLPEAPAEGATEVKA
jgi:ABC-2 type transport system ATP-binding protein